jgi:hypothetical protein
MKKLHNNSFTTENNCIEFVREEELRNLLRFVFCVFAYLVFSLSKLYSGSSFKADLVRKSLDNKHLEFKAFMI